MKDRTYFIEIPDRGTFEFHRFTISLKHRVSMAYQKLVDGDDSYLSQEERSNVWALAFINVMWISGPVQLDDLELAEADTLLRQIFDEVQKKDAFFRSATPRNPETESLGTSSESGVLVSTEILPNGD